ncbi:RNA-dependent RNA polymerase [Penicillium roseopurpureum negative ssRNA virus 1]|uniref:RNA-directed RNA polymerase L n=1 Tax=Penicillium roseopurpureum negative ssRNA virus 1 TaxID=2485920 RepID=A0A3G3C4N9_9VIRU|nr:RNA-dependent RNA polymerase [Penicillium roseopurpureum negative ssRNA virus 1]AYP71800.1 RNA-dependent RNA polymerase [Penicillium roseopurpureum negative ssRNA virus 1]
MSNVVVGIQSVSRTLSTRLAAPNDLDAFARGLTDSYLPKNQNDYATYRRYMHDILCLALIEVGVYHDEELTLGKLGISVNDKRLNMQKPDLYTKELTNIEVGEVTLSYNSGFDSDKKRVTYKDFLKLVSDKLGIQVNFNVIAVDLSDPEWEDSLPTLPSIHGKMLRSFIKNLSYIHAHRDYSSHRKDHSEFYALDKFRFELSEDIGEIMSVATRSKITTEEVVQRLEFSGHESLSDEEYLSLLAKGILSGPLFKRPTPHPEPQLNTELDDSWAKFCQAKKNTEKLPRILQLGAPLEMIEVSYSFDDVVKSLRSTNRTGGYLDMIKAFLSKKDPDENHIVHLSLSDSQLEKEQMEGPGRKAFLRRKGLKIERKPPTHIGISKEHEVILDDLIQQVEELTVSCNLKDLAQPQLSSVGPSMANVLNQIVESHHASPFSGVAKFYQRAAQEIVINSMRRRKNRQYVLCSSGFKDIFLLIAPGPQLRTESNTEFVKIISFCRPVHHVLSAPWLPTGDHWESEWLSVDTDRLKHWSRSFDRTFLGSVACAERLVELDKTIVKACRDEIKHGNYQLMILTYLEDKQLTSLTNQTLRYLWMKSLGDKQFSGIMSKFPSRVGSVIQSVMLQRAIKTTMNVNRSNLSDYIRVPASRQDDQTGNYDETTTGIVGKLPRLFTKGDMVPLSYNLNEIYWCMMYNKDRQNPAQDALSILNKVLKEEKKYEEEIDSRKTEEEKKNYTFGNSTLEQDLKHIHSKDPESHFYSRKAVQIGVRLQTIHEDNVAADYSWLTPAKLNAILSKNLSEYATFKASVKDLCRRVDVNDLKDIENVGKRTKAVELVAELVSNENLTQAFEVAMQFSGDNNKAFDVMIQIFKKGQIGGVREIMILYIKARVLFNIVEELCRLLSKSDKREILTKGKDKRLMMRGDYEEVMSQFPKGTPVQMIKNSYDMTTWAQKFIPTIFCTIYPEMLSEYPDLKRLAYFVFLKHTNKMIEYPRKLVEMWSRHKNEKHSEPWLQSAKEKFLNDGVPYFINHSNMCQGIPHYNSTVLALSCQSLRDALFHECLSQLDQDCLIRWKTRVGSDDKGDMIGVDMSNKFAYRQYLLFEQCAHAAERLHSMELSVKSAAGNILYELNSAFMANLETLSPTIKFALASCDMIQTSSCATFVNESYGRVRQLRENGGSSVLCGLAHMVNSDHFYTMFRTGMRMTNDVTEIFRVPKEMIPYDFGVYPFFDIDLQDIVGPEYYNYTVVTNPEVPLEIKQLLYTPLSRDDISEAFPSNEEEMLLKKDHFGIKQGLIKQLVSMRRRLSIVPDEVDKFFSDNPFLMVRGPETREETLKAIHSKLLTKGAAEALRRTSPAIYLGRLSAFESAKAWKIRRPNGTEIIDIDEGIAMELEDDVPATYQEFMSWGLLKAKQQNFPVGHMMNVIFPQATSYEVIKQFVGKFGLKRESAKKYSQAVRTWVVNNYNYNFNNSLKSILETSFGLSQLSSKEDVNEFRKLLNFNLDSYDGFITECKEKNLRPLDIFFYMTKIYKATRSSKVQAFANGPSTNSLNTTLISIKRYSHLPHTEMVMDIGLDPDDFLETNRQDVKIETLKFCCNLLLMECQGTVSGGLHVLDGCTINGTSLSEWCQTTIRTIRSISGFDFQTKKVLVFVASQVLQKDEFKEKLMIWNNLNYTYLKRQKKVISGNGHVSWEGDLKMLVNSGKNTFVLNIVNDVHFLTCKRIDDETTLLQALGEICRMLGVDVRAFFTKKPLRQGMLYLSENSKSLLMSSSRGPEHNCLNLMHQRKFEHMQLQDFDNFIITTSVDKKTFAVSVCLQEGDERSATLCHFPGNFYPASSPKGLMVYEGFWFKGLRLKTILRNQDWFYNYRLPSFTDSDTLEFFHNDVNFDMVLSQTTEEKGRILEYLQVMDEIDEEVFNLNTGGLVMQGNYVVSDLDFEEEVENVEDLFMEAMTGIKREGAFDFEPIEPGSFDWAEEAEEASKDTGLPPIEEEDGIRFVRSMGYKRRARKANMHVINQMQLGHILKERVLNMFFKNAAITSEDRKLLPNYYIWINNNRSSVGENLSGELQRVILTELHINMGATIQELKTTLDRANPSLSSAPPKLMNYTQGQVTDLYTQLSQNVGYSPVLYEESEGSENEY